MWNLFKIFGPGFLNSARETPRLYFLPICAISKSYQGKQLNKDEKTAALIFSATALALTS